MRALRTGGVYKICGDNLETFEKLPAYTYAVEYDQREGCYLVRHADICVTEKTYGVHNRKVNKVLTSFAIFERSMGVILSGDKGIGKSIFAKLLCERALKKGLPVIIVDACVPGISHFIESIDQECVILFDEFDKTFRSRNDNDEQAALLSLFDGTAGGKKLFIVTCNELYGLNDCIINRPGRFHYHFRFEYPTNDDIREYLRDKLKEEYYSEIDKVVAFSQKISLNYDCLRAIAFELNQGISFKEAANDLNILNINLEEYNIELYLSNGEILHHNRFSTNLYDNDGTYTWVTMYNDSEQSILDVMYDKRKVFYDVSLKSTVIYSDGLYLVFDDYDDEGSMKKNYNGVKPLYLLFDKCRGRNLHFAV